MTQRYFDKFRVITYNGNPVRDITQRAAVLSSVYKDPNIYYPYSIREQERPDNIANRYYKDDYLAWVLYLTNRVIDPYYDWNMDQQTFEKFIEKKYGSYVNAVSKVKFYRNNWYSYPDAITADQFNLLQDEQKIYWDSVPIDGVVVYNPIEYKRKQEDWVVNTNGVARYEVANGSAFFIDEIVDVTLNNVKSGRGQVVSSNTTHVALQHLFDTVTGTVTTTSFLTGRESGSNTTFTTATSVANNISSTVLTYWSPVTYYEYENEINEINRSIRVLSKDYTQQIASELKRLLK